MIGILQVYGRGPIPRSEEGEDGSGRFHSEVVWSGMHVDPF